MRFSPASKAAQLAVAALFIAALAGCATTWESDPVAAPPAGKTVEQQAIDDAVGAPAWLIFDTQVAADWKSLNGTANDACLASLQGSTETDFSAQFDGVAAHYNAAQQSVLDGSGAVKTGYPATVPVLPQTQPGTADWCAVPGLLGAARS